MLSLRFAMARMIARDSFGLWQLVVRHLAHRPRQTSLIILIGALISGTAVFAAGYQHQVQQAVVGAAFAVDGPGSAWSLTSQPGVSLTELIPPGSQRLTQRPISGRTAAVAWHAPRAEAPAISGTLRSRDEVCGHLVIVSGRCPSTIGEVAVSSSDAGTYGVRTGDRLTVVATLGPENQFIVSGIYRVDDPNNPYWFDNSPVGRSRFNDEHPQADALITVNASFQTPIYEETLDLRIDGAAVGTADLPRLESYTQALADAAAQHQGRLTSGVPDSLERIAQERHRAVAGLTLSLAQLAVLVGVVLALLAAVELSAQRAELGLARVRGEPAVRLGRVVVARWAVVITAGWLIGWVPAVVLLAKALPDGGGLQPSPALAAVPLAALVIMVVVIVPPARAMLAQPVMGLLRAAPSAARDTGRQLMVDIVLLVLAVSGLLVSVQAGTTSVLGLLVPSLLAVGAGVVLFRLLARLAVRRRHRLTHDGARPAALLTATLMVRLRGLRLLVIALTVAAAFAVFAVQLQAIGSDVRRHDAEVRTGAAAVLQLEGDPVAVVRSLARVDPRHNASDAAMTAVVITRRRDPDALRGMFIEPGAFPRIAYGADRSTDAATWQRISAPRVEPVTFRGDSISARIEPHPDLGRTSPDEPIRTGTRAELGIDYLSPDGTLHSLALGQLRLSSGGGVRLQRPISCQDGCRLLRITLRPDGPMEGRLPLTSLQIRRAGVTQSVDLGPAGRWQSVPTAVPDDQLRLEPHNGGLILTTRSGGGPLAVQQAWVPLVLPVLVAARARLPTDPTLAAPDGSQLAIDPVVRAVDAVPNQLQGVAVADLESALRAGEGKAAPDTAVQVWVAERAVGRLSELERAMAEEGVRVISTRTAEQAVVANGVTASALSGRLAPGLAALAAVFAGLGVALTISSHRSVLGHDLAALRLAGLRYATVRRAATLTYLWPGLLAVILGSLAGAVVCPLVIPELPMLADPEPAIHADLRLRPIAFLGCVLAGAGALTCVVLVSVQQLYRGYVVDQLKGLP
jgi:putative ABC transport system permease protein